MKKNILMYGMLALLIAGCKKGVDQSQQKEKEIQHNMEERGQIAVNTTAAASIDVFPVRGLHNTGYDHSLDCGCQDSWNCNRDHSNSDFVAGDHLGIDIWAAEGTPVAATVGGTLVLTGWSDYSGNKVTVRTSTGWSHFFCHLKSIASGMVNGKVVKAGDIIGYVGHTGTASNGVTHLHYSLYPDAVYDNAINPWNLLYAKELNVCSTTPPPASKYIDDFEDGVGHFYTQPTFSGSTVGIAATSASSHYVNGTSTHLQVDLDDNTSVTTNWRVRLLSGEGIPANNVSVSKNGTFHIWLKTNTAVSGATVQIYMDDSDGTEGSTTIAVVNDGEWHEYEWNLSTWSGVNVSGGNGLLDAANVTLDAIVLNSPNRSGRWTAFIDDVIWHPL
jgi:hypothetical protein